MQEICCLSIRDINEAKYACLKMFIFRLEYDCIEIKLDNGTINKGYANLLLEVHLRFIQTFLKKKYILRNEYIQF